MSLGFQQQTDSPKNDAPSARPSRRSSVDADAATKTGEGRETSLASRVANAAAHARRGSCCVADFANVAVRGNRPSHVQTKPAISAIGDAHERQADAAADRVTRMSRTDATTNDERSPGASRDGGNIDRDTRAFMQHRLGADFGDVRLHTDDRADSLSGALNARAFTVGRDIYFASGEYAPASDRGRHLLAHELTHTIQQRPARLLQRAPMAQGIEGAVQHAVESSEFEREGGTPIVAAPPMIQRSTRWSGATVHETRNVADMAMGGTWPVSWPLLNGKLMKREPDADAAMKGHEPTISARGSKTKWKAKVVTVPLQKGAVDETVVSPGPWTLATTKAAVGAALGIPACAGNGQSTLTAHGQNTDDEVYKANRRHEDRHVDDIRVAFDETIVEWDKKLQDAKKKGTRYEGTSEPEAKANLWAAMGDTPQNLARQFLSLTMSKGDDFHNTAAGGKMHASNPRSSPDCSTSDVDVTNPS